MGNNIYNITGSTVNGSGIGPDSMVLANYSNQNGVTIPQIIVHAGVTREDIIRMGLVTRLLFKKQSPLANDLHALSILLYRENTRLCHIVFFLFNGFQH